MSFTLVQSKPVSSAATSATLTLTEDVTAGNLLYVTTGCYSSIGSTSSTLSDSQGNTYTLLETAPTGGSDGTLCTYYTTVGSTGSLTITCTGVLLVQSCQIIAAEYNAAGWAYANKSSQNGVDQETFATGSMTFSGNALVLVSVLSTDATALSAGSGYTLVQTTGSAPCLGVANLLNTTSSPASPTMTSTAFSFDWSSAGAVFTVTSPPGTFTADTAICNSALDAIVTAAGSTAVIEVFTGLPAGKTGDDWNADAGTLLISWPLADPIGTVSDGVLTFSPSSTATVVASGTPQSARLKTVAGGGVGDVIFEVDAAVGSGSINLDAIPQVGMTGELSGVSLASNWM